MWQWILKLSSCSSNAGMGTSAPLINAIGNNVLLHSNSRIKQMPHQIIHIVRFCGRLAAPDFVMKCTEARAVRWPEVWELWVSYNIALSDWRSKWCTECQRRHSSRKRFVPNLMQILSIFLKLQVVKQSGPGFWAYPVYHAISHYHF